jgi:hypothetical protein
VGTFESVGVDRMEAMEGVGASEGMRMFGSREASVG